MSDFTIFPPEEVSSQEIITDDGDSEFESAEDDPEAIEGEVDSDTIPYKNSGTHISMQRLSWTKNMKTKTKTRMTTRVTTRTRTRRYQLVILVRLSSLKHHLS